MYSGFSYGSMKKVILFICCSTDGFIARKNGDVSWLLHDQDYGYKKFVASVDTLLMGRKTYKQCLTFGEWPWKGKKSFVFTRKKQKKDSNVEFVKNPVAFTKKLVKKQGKSIWLVGGG